MNFPSIGTVRRDSAAVIFALAYPTLLTIVYFILLADEPAWIQQAAYAFGKGIQFVFPLAWVILVQRPSPRSDERRENSARTMASGGHKSAGGPARDCGFNSAERTIRPSWRPRGKDLAIGAGLGLALFAAALGLYLLWIRPAGLFDAAAVEVRKKVAGIGVDSGPRFAVLAIFYSFVHSLLEEYYWRWFVFAQLRRLTSFVPAAAVSSLGFMAHHVLVLAVYFGGSSPLTWLLSLAVAVGGTIWAGMYEKTGSLAGTWISHAFVDAAIFLVGYDLLN